MLNVNDVSSIKDAFKASVANIIDMYDNECPNMLDDKNIVDMCGPVVGTVIRYQYIATINGHKIYIDSSDAIYEYRKMHILFFIPFRKMVYIGKPLFIKDIALLYKAHSLYDYIREKRDRYFEKKRLEALFKGAQ